MGSALFLVFIRWGSGTALVVGVIAIALTIPDHVSFVDSYSEATAKAGREGQFQAGSG